MMYKSVSIAIFTLCIALIEVSADWPQFQGPDRNGISPEKGLLRQWPEGGPKVLWQVEVGEGFGGASIQDQKVYFLDRLEDSDDVLRCLDLETGKELWRFSHMVPGRLTYNGSRNVPLVDDERIYAVGPFGHVYCVNKTTHQEIWRLEVAQQFDKQIHSIGFVCHPLVYKDTLIVTPLAEKVGLVALHVETGDIVWQTEGVGTESFNSVVLAKLGGQQQLLILTRYQISGVDPDTGIILWKYTDFQCMVPVPFPTRIDDEQIFITGGYDDLGSIMARVVKKENHFEFEEVYRIKKGSQVHQVLLYQNHLFGNFNNNDNLARKEPDGLMCLDLTGNIKWQTKANPHVERGNLIIANDMIFIMGGDTGVLTLVEANPEKYVQLASAKVLDAKKEIFAPMALSNGRLVVRDHQIMKCLIISTSGYIASGKVNDTISVAR